MSAMPEQKHYWKRKRI